MKIAIIISLFSFGSSVFANGNTYVHGYVKKDGTYVEPYNRSKSDSYEDNNYSHKGNYNPYTGQKGTKDSYGRDYNE